MGAGTGVLVLRRKGGHRGNEGSDNTTHVKSGDLVSVPCVLPKITYSVTRSCAEFLSSSQEDVACSPVHKNITQTHLAEISGLNGPEAT